MERVLFLNYLSMNSPKDALLEYKRQHRLFVTSALYIQRNAIVTSMTGVRGDDRFIEALETLKEHKNKYNYPTMYLDSDCVLMNPIDDLFDNYDFDVGVVYRYHWIKDKNDIMRHLGKKVYRQSTGNHDCLGGFLFFPQKRKDAEEYFLDKLIKKTEEHYMKEKKSTVCFMSFGDLTF